MDNENQKPETRNQETRRKDKDMDRANLLTYSIIFYEGRTQRNGRNQNQSFA